SGARVLGAPKVQRSGRPEAVQWSLAQARCSTGAALVRALASMVCKRSGTGSRVKREFHARFCERLQGQFLRSTHQERVRRCGLASQVPRARGGIVPEESRALSGREFAALRAAPIASSSTATVQCRAPHMSVRVLVIRCCFTYPV